MSLTDRENAREALTISDKGGDQCHGWGGGGDRSPLLKSILQMNQNVKVYLEKLRKRVKRVFTLHTFRTDTSKSVKTFFLLIGTLLQKS